MSAAPFNLYLLANSPGELSNWVKPIIAAFQKKVQNLHIEIFILPCQYASGKEVEYALGLKGVNKVYSSRESMKQVLTFFKKDKKEKGLIFFLGGDPLYARLLGRKFAMPVYAYTEHKNFPKKGFKKVFYINDIGDLMGDMTLISPPKKENKHGDYLLFLTGSRPQHFIHLIPMYRSIVNALREHGQKDHKIIFLKSPFINYSLAAPFIEDLKIDNIVMQDHDQKTLMAHAKFIITIPGTNTAELAYLQKPFLCLTATNEPKVIIFDGLMGLIGNLPLFGVLVKKLIIYVITRKKRFYAKPNMISNRELVPEMVGKLDPEDVARVIESNMAQDNLEAIKDRLKPLKPSFSIGDKIVDLILKSS